MRETQGRTRAAWDSPTAELEKCVDAQLCSGSDQKWPGTVWHPETMGHITAAAASERIPRLLWHRVVRSATPVPRPGTPSETLSERLMEMVLVADLPEPATSSKPKAGVDFPYLPLPAEATRSMNADSNVDFIQSLTHKDYTEKAFVARKACAEVSASTAK